MLGNEYARMSCSVRGSEPYLFSRIRISTASAKANGTAYPVGLIYLIGLDLAAYLIAKARELLGIE
jgi:hypothetical protein